MLMNAALAFYRSLMRHKLYAGLNLFGLAAGIAVFLTLTMVVQYERSYDRWIPAAPAIYRLDQTWTLAGRARQESANTPFVALPFLLADFPQIEAATRLLDRGAPVRVGDVIGQETVTYVDPNLFDVLALPMVLGDRAHSLANPASAVISQGMARKYFGGGPAIGHTIIISQDGIRRPYTVTGIIRDLPAASTLMLSILAPLTPTLEQHVAAFHSWNSASGDTYLKFRSRDDAKTVSAGLAGFVACRADGDGDGQVGPHPGDIFALSLVALPDLHFHDVNVGSAAPGTDARLIYSLEAVGVLALALAAINYVNLATARSGLRAREVALRKVLGATRAVLLRQFLSEAMVLVSASALIGLALAELALPFINALGNWDIRIDYLSVSAMLAAIIVLVGLGAGIYPAMRLAAYQPAAVLASARTPAGGRIGARARTLLVLVQFSSAIALTICTLVINRQAEFLRHADRGFDREGLIVVNTTEAPELLDRQQTILDQLRAVPGVDAVTVSDREPNSDDLNATTVSRPGLKGSAPSMVHETVGPDYFRTYGIRLLAGRPFDQTHRTDDRAMKTAPGSARTTSMIVNHAAVSMLGYPDPASILGQHFFTDDGSGRADHVVIGVVQDVRFMSAHAPVDAQFYLYDARQVADGEAAIRFSNVPEAEIMRRLQIVWQQAAPDNPFVAMTADARLAPFYRPDAQRAGLFSIATILALAIACIGMYGLASFNTARRTREIGIRKTLGATTSAVLLLLVRQFVSPVALANLVAWPVAWIAMRAWLSGFDQRVPLSASYFLAATGLAILLSILTVLGQAIRVARAEPSHALRYS